MLLHPTWLIHKWPACTCLLNSLKYQPNASNLLDIDNTPAKLLGPHHFLSLTTRGKRTVGSLISTKSKRISKKFQHLNQNCSGFTCLWMQLG
jgi:hypothetical protein